MRKRDQYKRLLRIASAMMIVLIQTVLFALVWYIDYAKDGSNHFVRGNYVIVGLYGAMIVSLILTTLVIEVPFLAAAFDFTPISLLEYAIALALAVLIIPIMEAVKAVQRAMGSRA